MLGRVGKFFDSSHSGLSGEVLVGFLSLRAYLREGGHIREAAVGNLRRHANRFTRSWMRVNRLADVRASAPISIASAISPIMSPACVPTMPPPRILPWAWAWASGESSNSSLMTRSSRPLAMARPEFVHPNRPFLTLMPCLFALTHPCHFRAGVGHAGDESGVERCGAN